MRLFSSTYQECKKKNKYIYIYSKRKEKYFNKRSKNGFSEKNDHEWFDLLFLPYLLWCQQDPEAQRSIQK